MSRATHSLMQVGIVEISQFDTLTKFHRGISHAEALVMVKMLNDGADLCIVNDNDDVLLILRWEVIRTDGAGQLLSVSECLYEEWKSKGFESDMP